MCLGAARELRAAAANGGIGFSTWSRHIVYRQGGDRQRRYRGRKCRIENSTDQKDGLALGLGMCVACACGQRTRLEVRGGGVKVKGGGEEVHCIWSGGGCSGTRLRRLEWRMEWPGCREEPLADLSLNWTAIWRVEVGGGGGGGQNDTKSLLCLWVESWVLVCKRKRSSEDTERPLSSQRPFCGALCVLEMSVESRVEELWPVHVWQRWLE